MIKILLGIVVVVIIIAGLYMSGESPHPPTSEE